MQIRVVPALCLAFLVASLPAPAQAQALGESYHVELGFMSWKPTPELVIGSDAFRVVGSDTIDFVQEFALENERFREFRATIKPGRKHKIRISHVPIRYEKTATITRAITLNGRTFPAQADVTADIDWSLWRFGYEWDFVSGGRGFLGVIGELKYNQVKASLAGTDISIPGSTLSATADATAPLPTIGVVARVYAAPAVSLTGEFTGLKVPDGFSDSVDGKFYELDIYGMLNLGRYAAVQLGYRSTKTDYVVDDDSGDLRLKGVYFGGMLRF